MTCACIYCNDPCQQDDPKDILCRACRKARPAVKAAGIPPNTKPGDSGPCHPKE